jgi:putative Mn2+ efflux pump MntP
MGVIEILLLGIGLSMDAFAVSICKGLSMKKINWKKAFILGIYFGIFQALMPVIGYFLGYAFESFVTSIDHWIALILLLLIGGKMIKEAFSKDESDNCNENVDFKIMVILAIATSIDALAVGITFAFLNVNLILAVTLIGIITFIISLIGVAIGNKFGRKHENKAEILGGAVLIFIGLKILLEHLMLI